MQGRTRTRTQNDTMPCPEIASIHARDDIMSCQEWHHVMPGMRRCHARGRIFIPDNVCEGFFAKIICRTTFHLHLHILTSAHLHSHLYFCSSSHLHIYISAHLHILTSTSRLIFTVTPVGLAFGSVIEVAIWRAAPPKQMLPPQLAQLEPYDP